MQLLTQSVLLANKLYHRCNNKIRWLINQAIRPELDQNHVAVIIMHHGRRIRNPRREEPGTGKLGTTSCIQPRGSGLRDFNIEQARVMAVRTAQASPAIRRWILRKRMLFDVLSDSEDENTYTIVLAFRPSEDFEGTPGQKRIKISKAGRFQSREVLSHPKSFKRFSFKRRTVLTSIIAVAAIIGFLVLVFYLIDAYQDYGEINVR